MAVERRFWMGPWQTSPSDDDDPGIIIKSDGAVAIVDSAGDEPFIIAAGGGVIVSLPTADPNVAGQLWSNSGVVTVSAG